MSHAMIRITTSVKAARQDMVSMRTASKLRVTLRDSDAAAKCLLTRSCNAKFFFKGATAGQRVHDTPNNISTILQRKNKSKNKIARRMKDLG